MSILEILTEENTLLREVSSKVEVIDKELLKFLDDMAETMYEADGVGLAAVQVGVLKRIVVIDVGEGLIELINPKLSRFTGSQIEVEGCLSVPEVFGEVERPAKVWVEAINRKGRKIRVKGEKLLAIALCHEIDHLEGILFKDKVIRYIEKEEMEKRRSELE